MRASERSRPPMCRNFELQLRAAAKRIRQADSSILKGAVVGKYFLGWILGVPVVALVIIFLPFN